MTIILTTKLILEQLAPWADVVYPNVIPEEEQDKTDKTVILVRPAYDRLETYGSDIFNTITNNLVIQVFYAKGNSLDYDVLEARLYRDLTAKGYTIDDIKGRTIDLDTDQDYQTFSITKNRNLKDLI